MTRTLRWRRWTVAALAGALGLAMAATLAGLFAVHASVPVLDGRQHLAGLAQPASVRRDAQGTALVEAANRIDAARALGYVHAQERFFEMDLARRSAAGELSALFGPAALDHDRQRRVHRMRARLQSRLASLPESDRALLAAYAEGVGAGLAALHGRPWQYLLLRAQPEPWRPVDSLLVIAEMYWMLQADSVDRGFEAALLREKLGDALFGILDPPGGHWDAALDGSRIDAVELPPPSRLDVRRSAAAAAGDSGAGPARDEARGSNAFALAGSRVEDGGALLASDMHLGLGVPSTWFRVELRIGQGAGAVRAAGLTLPGTPALVVGSNGSVAWGFTNAYGQWFDWIRLPAELPDSRLVSMHERIAVKGGADVDLQVSELDGDPVVREHDGVRYALRWVAHEGEAYTLALDEMLGAHDVDAAVAIAHRSGMPQQNLLVADRAGHIAWTLAGRLWADPRDAAFAHWSAPGLPPHAWLDPARVPVVKDPPEGQLWSANNRPLGGAAAAVLGDGGFDLGARAQQIRDRLAATPRFGPAGFGELQFDNEARFMRAWAGRVAAAADGSPRHAEVLALIRGWNGRADADEAAYRLVRGVRVRVLDALWRSWTHPFLEAPHAASGASAAAPADSGAARRRPPWPPRFEYAASLALDDRPAHLLPRPYETWGAFLLAQVDAEVDEMTRHGRRPLAAATWGEANASSLRSVISRAVPALSKVLDMPSLPQGGDGNLPHVAAPAFGQSERLVVSPGHEERATLVIAGGQSGHPMSPYYGAGQAQWAEGTLVPLLAGRSEHTLTLLP